MIDLLKDVKYIKGVGPERVKSLNKLGIYTLEDLITYYPRTYEDRSKAKKIPLFPAVFFNFSPPFSPFSKHHVKNFPIIFLSFPHSRTFLANR